jgi:uncharacterized membrane protein YsdA (DUF1294 family)/cold shock CspA family protein
MRSKGIITRWYDDKGYGFIKPADGGKQVFVHIRAFASRNRRPAINQVVTYAMSSDKQGRPCATRATLAGDRFSINRIISNDSVLVIAAVFFLGIVGVAVLAGKVPNWVLGLYMVASTLTFIMYAMDKSAARKGHWRTQESTLHVMSLAGGWPGALVAQQKLRHKSRKKSFRSVFWATVLLNVGVFIWLLTPTGIDAFKALIAEVI